MKIIQGSLSLLLILCAFLCRGTPASASDPVKNTPGASQVLSQEDCIAIALKNNKDIKLSASKEAVAQATLNYEKSLYFPKLSLYSQAGATNAAGFTLQGTLVTPAQQGRQNLLFHNRDFYRYETRMEVPLYRDGFFGFKSHKIARADYGLQQSRYQRDSTKLSIISQVKDYFLLVQKAQVKQDLHKKTIGYNQDVLKLVQEKYHRQLSSHKDVLMAEANLAKAQADLAVSENEYQRLAKQLFLLIGASTSAPLRVAPPKQELSPLPLWKEVQEKVPANNLDLKASKLNIDIAKEDLALSKNNLWPTVDLYARYFGSDSEYRDARDSYATYVFLQVPIFDKSIFKDVKVKKEKIVQASETYQVDTESILKTAIDQYKELQDIRPQLNSTKKQITYNEENFREKKAKYAQDLISFIDLANAQLELQRSNKLSIDLYFDYEIGLRNLQNLMGENAVSTSDSPSP